MIDTEIEKFTAESAIEAGLINAVQRGDCVINGSYKLTADGYLDLEQNNFVFTDKYGDLRIGKFADKKDLLFFALKVNDLHFIESCK